MMKIFSGYITNTIEDEKIDIDLTENPLDMIGEEKCWKKCHKEAFCAAAVWDTSLHKCSLKERVIFFNDLTPSTVEFLPKIKLYA